MAQRLATEYVKTCLVLNEAEWNQLLELFQSHNLLFKVKVLDNGEHEIAIADGPGPELLVLTFASRSGTYVLEGSCRFTDLRLANAMRKAVAEFKGDALVNRIYAYHTMQYEYRAGAVVRIAEISERGERLVYERKDLLGEFSRAFRCGSVEAQIQVVRVEINEWLDRRIDAWRGDEVKRIDAELNRLSHQLFILEA